MFSVVIPVYNHRQFLLEAILSSVQSPLVSQVIVADDGSSDGSAELLRELSSRIPKLRNVSEDRPVNRGAHNRLNQLIGSSSSEWVSILNSDDILAPGRFEVLRWLFRHQRAEFYFGSLGIIDSQGRRVGRKDALRALPWPWPSDVDVQRYAVEQDWLPLLLNQNLIATTSNMVFKKSLFDVVGGFRDFRYVHDWDFALRAAVHGRMCYAPQMQTLYRLHARNTIREDNLGTAAEVTLMTRRFFEDYPALSETSPRVGRQRDMGRLVEGNPMLRHLDPSLLAIVLPQAGADSLRGRIEADIPWIQCVSRLSEVPDARYIYAPTDGDEALDLNTLKNVLLTLSITEPDFVLVSYGLHEFPLIGARNVRDNAVFRADYMQDVRSGLPVRKDASGQLLRTSVRMLPAQHVGRLWPAGKIRFQDGALSMGSGQAGTEARPRHERYPGCLAVRPGTLPTAFVLPAFLAVGGVERIAIEMMERLKSEFRFVIVTTERLLPHQGSLVQEALQHAEAIYDLPELMPRHDYAAAFRFLRHAYRPSLLWIVNGSTWQVQNAGLLRSIFLDSAIVDHQVYDTKIGWIEHFAKEDVRKADRFVAVNTRIAAAFEKEHGINPEMIDLIYHPVRTERLVRRKGGREAALRRYGLPQGKTIFAFIGRVTSQKRPMDFIGLAERAKEQRRKQDFFIMVGDGDLGGACDQVIRDSELDNIKRLGFCEDIPALLQAVDGVVILSEYEGLPISMLECLTLGVPVLATDVGDIRKILEAYRSGAVIEEIGNADAAFQAFVEWSADLSRYTDAAQAAVPAMKARFSVEKVAAQYRETFARAVEEVKTRRRVRERLPV
jgi:glycosyltransferase involved in cell wall biosynthesis